jgi:hypothetical protein
LDSTALLSLFAEGYFYVFSLSVTFQNQNIYSWSAVIDSFCMLVLRSCPTLLPRLLLAPQRLLSTIGRKPRVQTWLTAGLTAAADGSKEPAVGCIHSSSSGRCGSSSGSNKGSRAGIVVSATADDASVLGSAADMVSQVSEQPGRLQWVPQMSPAAVVQ